MAGSSLSSSSKLAVVGVLFMWATLVEATSFLKSGMVDKADAEHFFESELSSDRLADTEKTLTETFNSLPKNSHGNLGHQAVRYVLHRYFVQRYGWYVKGLEPGNNTWKSDVSPTEVLEWVPTYLQDMLEKHLGMRGTSLRELSALAAAFEDLVDKEVAGRLETAYAMHAFPVDKALSKDEVEALLQTYTMALLVGGNYTAAGTGEMEHKEKLFATKYTDWPLVQGWMRGLMSKRLAGQAVSESFNFSAVVQAAADIGKGYYAVNDPECTDLKGTLRAIEGSKAGRVRLSTFYNKSLFTHWAFNEKIDYLRILGVLDETNPDAPQVIMPNYLMSRTNCLESSNLYAICCRNECEDLMSTLERDVAAPSASPERIIGVVANMPSDTVSAPREIPASLMKRLNEVAWMPGNRGQVPLHGRLFAEWMHHAYPRECPYPHLVGTTSPQSPDEWMKETGHDDIKATRDEMKYIVDGDACAAQFGPLGQIVVPEGCEGEHTEDLPWSQTEELLERRDESIIEDSEAPSGDDVFVSVATLVVGLLLLVAVVVNVMGGPASKRMGDLRSALILAVLFVATRALNLLDPTVFLFTLVGGGLLIGSKALVDNRLAQKEQAALDAKVDAEKCCV